MRDDAVKARRCGELGVDVLRVDVARHRGEELDVRSGQRALDARVVADGDLVERAVADDFEVVRCEGACSCLVSRKDVETAVDVVGVAGDRARGVAHEERAERADVFDLD